MKKFSIFILAFFLIWFYFYANVTPDPPKIPIKVYISTNTTFWSWIYSIDLSSIKENVNWHEYWVFAKKEQSYTWLILQKSLINESYSLDNYTLLKNGKKIDDIELWFYKSYTWYNQDYLIYSWVRYWDNSKIDFTSKISLQIATLSIFDLRSNSVFRIYVFDSDERNNRAIHVQEILGYKNLAK